MGEVADLVGGRTAQLAHRFRDVALELPERYLHCVLGVLSVRADTPRETPQIRLACNEQALKDRSITIASRFHQV